MNPEPLLPVEGGSGQRGLRSLHDSQRVVADTQQLGIGVIEQLGSQREVLHGAVERQEEMSTLLARSSQLLRTMLRRANWIKAILLFIVFVLLLTIFFIGWHKWGGKHPPAEPKHAALSTAFNLTSSAAAAASTALSKAATAAPAAAAPADPLPRRLSELGLSTESRPVGAGIIVIFVFGLLALAALFLAAALQPVQRCAVSCVVAVLLGAILAVLLVYPRDDGVESTGGRTDASRLMRALVALLLMLTALGGCVTILVTHLVPPQIIRLPMELADCKEAA